MKIISFIIYMFLLVIFMSVLVRSCFTSSHNNLNKCINNYISNNFIIYKAKNEKFCSKDVEICWSRVLNNKMAIHEIELRKLNFKAEIQDNNNLLKLNQRYLQAIECLNKIGCKTKKYMLMAIDCCIGEKSHFMLNKIKNTNKNVDEYYYDCMMSVYEEIKK